MAVEESQVCLQHVNLIYPITTGIRKLFTHEVISALVGGVVEIDPRHREVRIQALTDINLHLTRGSRTALIGNNGAGKSTLLKVIAGILHGDSGVRVISGKIVPLLDTNVGLDNESSAYENIFLRGLLLGLSVKELREIANDIVELAGLGEFIHLPLRTFSAGMRNRLAFAISISVKPDILVVDEGFGAGDWKFMEAASKRFDKLLDGTQLLVFATHNEDLMRQFCNQGVVMNKGSITFVGPIEDAISFYRDDAIAEL